MAEKVFKFAMAACGHPSNRNKRECSACYRKRLNEKDPTAKERKAAYNKQYRKDNPDKNAAYRRNYYHSSEAAKQKIKEANNEWERNNRDKRNAIVHRWQDRTGRRPPRELIELRRAVKRLEKAVEEAKKRS